MVIFLKLATFSQRNNTHTHRHRMYSVHQTPTHIVWARPKDSQWVAPALCGIIRSHIFTILLHSLASFTGNVTSGVFHHDTEYCMLLRRIWSFLTALPANMCFPFWCSMMLLLRVIHLLLLYLFAADSTLKIYTNRCQWLITGNCFCSCLDSFMTTISHICQNKFSGTLIAYTHCKFWFVASNSLLKGLKYIWWITPHPIKNLHRVAIDYSCKPTCLNRIKPPKASMSHIGE